MAYFVLNGMLMWVASIRRPDGHEHQAAASGTCFGAGSGKRFGAEDEAEKGARRSDRRIEILGRRVLVPPRRRLRSAVECVVKARGGAGSEEEFVNNTWVWK